MSNFHYRRYPVSDFHHRHYRYVRMMLRRYPKMRDELLGLTGNAGARAICQRKNMDKHMVFLIKAANEHFLRCGQPLFDGEESLRAKTMATLAGRRYKAGRSIR